MFYWKMLGWCIIFLFFGREIIDYLVKCVAALFMWVKLAYDLRPQYRFVRIERTHRRR